MGLHADPFGRNSAGPFASRRPAARTLRYDAAVRSGGDRMDGIIDNRDQGKTMNKVSLPLRLAAVVLAAVFAQGCSTATQLVGSKPGTTLEVRDVGKVELPQARKLSSKATGQHEFRAISADGQQMYGILPMRVNGGRMATSILFFAPALFIGGFRDVFHYYQFDPDAGTVGYKSDERDEWRFYKPSAAESERARQYFETGTPQGTGQ